MKTTLVAAITRYTCSLACLESFSRDAGLFFTQADLLKYHPTILLDPNKSEQFGAIDLGRLLALCQALALSPQPQRNFDFAQMLPVLQNLRPEQTALFFVLDFLKSGNCHTVRFDSIVGGTTLKIMNPSFLSARFQDVDWNDLVAGDVTTIVLSR